MTLKTSMKGSAKKVKKDVKSQDASDSKVEASKKPNLQLAVESSSVYNLNQAKVAPFVEALLKVHNTKPKNANPDKKKSKLFGEEETPVKLQISGIKIPREDRKHVIRV